MKLVICEKNIAARRIAYILSSGKSQTKSLGKTPVYEFVKNNERWNVIGLRGHIINLDYPAEYNSWNRISPKNLIYIEPFKKVSEKGIANALKSLVSNNDFLVVATDYDREGELIGLEAVDLIKDFKKNINYIKRAKFSAITNQEIIEAFGNFSDLDYNLAHSGEARQKIDLIWGAVLTRFISITSHKLGKDFLSIGRVQSPTLALLVEREKEIENFEPKSYWKIIADLEKQKKFEAYHEKGQIWNEKQAEEIFQKVRNSENAIVKDVKKETVKELPPSPFNTTSFLQAASSLGFSASKAMGIAEELYMMGLTSYPRTDNTVYPPSLNIRGILEKLKNSIFFEEASEVLNNGRNRPTRGKKLTTDHPPIHPVGTAPDKKLTEEQRKIYELICRRFLATLSRDVISETMTVDLIIKGEIFKATGYRIIEANWKKIYHYYKENRKPLPEIIKDETIRIIKINLKEDKTKPPRSYTQGSLIAKMEQLSLGTKSTRHEIINKLYARRYISGKNLKPTKTAMAVIDALSNCDVIKTKMTAKLEIDMNLISEGKKTLDETVEESRKMLDNVIITLETEKEKIKTNIIKAHVMENTVGICPICGQKMIIRNSRKGKRFAGCIGYPNCKNTYSLPQNGVIIKTDLKCEKCGSPVVKIKSKGKRSWDLCLEPTCDNKKPQKKNNVST